MTQPIESAKATRPMRLAMMEIKSRFEVNIQWFESEAKKFHRLSATEGMQWYNNAMECESKAALLREMCNMVLDELGRAQASVERESIEHAILHGYEDRPADIPLDPRY